jgi:glycosyltransferase involved in cell wall biosynthesis
MSLGALLLKKPDVIFGYTALAGIASIWLGARFRAPVLLDVPDLWPDVLTETKMIEKGPVYWSAMAMCLFIYRNIDVFSVWHPGFKDVLVQRGASEERINTIENWIDPDLYGPVPYNNDLAKQYGLEGKFNIIFAGNLGIGQGLDTVIEAAQLLSSHDEIQMVIIGNGSCFSHLQRYAKQLGCNNVRFLGQHPVERMASFFALGDALLVHLKDERTFEMTVPAKTHSYMACGKPIIMGVKGEAARLINSSGCGIVCPPENPQALADTVIQLKHMNASERERMGQAGLGLFESRFTKSVLLSKLENLIFDTASIPIG